MLNIRVELRSLIARKGTSMNKTVHALREAGIISSGPSNMSAKIINKTIKFEEVQQILDYLGYKLVIEEK